MSVTSGGGIPTPIGAIGADVNVIDVFDADDLLSWPPLPGYILLITSIDVSYRGFSSSARPPIQFAFNNSGAFFAGALVDGTLEAGWFHWRGAIQMSTTDAVHVIGDGQWIGVITGHYVPQHAYPT